MNLEIKLLISQVIGFLIMLYILKRLAWKPPLKILQERKNKIQAEFDHIEKEKANAQDLVNAYHNKLSLIEEEAKARINEAINGGRVQAQAIQAQAHEEARLILNKAKSDIVLEISEAKVALKEEIVALVIKASEKLIQENLHEKKQQALIEEFVDKATLK